MELLIVSGSHRPYSQSHKVARFAEYLVGKTTPEFARVSVLDLGETNLSFWEEDETRSGYAARAPAWEPISTRMAASDAFVIVVPEWSGMAPPKLKNLLLMCDRHELAHKPALLIGISSGYGGAYPLAELRANSSKDTHVCYIPETVIVRKVSDYLNSSNPRDTMDESIHRRIVYSLRVLAAYASSLKSIRERGVMDLEQFQYGI